MQSRSQTPGEVAIYLRGGVFEQDATHIQISQLVSYLQLNAVIFQCARSLT